MAANNPVQLMADICERTGASVVLIGGFAVNYHQFSRATSDLDFLVVEPDYEKLFKLLEAEAGYEEVYRQHAFARLSTKKPYWMDIDFNFVDADTFDAVKQAAVRVDLEGRPFLIPSLNHLIALKLHAINNNPENRLSKDLIDIVELVKANKVDVDAKDFREMCRQFGPSGIYERIKEAG